MAPKASTLIRLSCLLTKKNLSTIHHSSIYLTITKHYFIDIMHRFLKLHISPTNYSSKSVSPNQNCSDLKSAACTQASNYSVTVASK